MWLRRISAHGKTRDSEMFLQDRWIVSWFFPPALISASLCSGGLLFTEEASVFPCLAQGCWFRSTSHSSDTSGIVSCSQLVLCICSSRPAGFYKPLSHQNAVKCAAHPDSFSKKEKVSKHKTEHYSRISLETRTRSCGLIVKSEQIIFSLRFYFKNVFENKMFASMGLRIKKTLSKLLQNAFICLLFRLFEML